MILFTFYWSYIFPSFFWRTSIKEDTHIWLIKYAAKLCLLAAWWEIVYSLLKTYWRKRLSCIIMLPRSLLLHACMHGLVVMCTLCTYSTIFQACPTCVLRTCRCVLCRSVDDCSVSHALTLWTSLMTYLLELCSGLVPFFILVS